MALCAREMKKIEGERVTVATLGTNSSSPYAEFCGFRGGGDDVEE